MRHGRQHEADTGPANDVPLSPLSFLHRRAEIDGDAIGVVTDAGEWVSWSRLLERAQRLAARLAELGLGNGDRVAVLAPNDLPLLEAHYGVPGAGCALVALNTRLSPQEYELVLRLSQAKVLIVDDSLAAQVGGIAERVPSLRAVVTIGAEGEGYADWLRTAQPTALHLPRDERQPLAVNFTSGTTGKPKGVVYTHRGAYLNALGQLVSVGLGANSRYLWTLPMFHCNGWCYTWAVTAAGARHVALRKMDPARVLELIDREQVTHLCGAPVVLDGLVEASESHPATEPAQRVLFAVGGAAPSANAIGAMARHGIDVVHLYGMTETYGPSLLCLPRPEWHEYPPARQARLMARQGVQTVNVESVRVVGDGFDDVPADGHTLGELVIRSNTVMSHYLDDQQATAAAFSGGWLHTGDAAVRHPDGYVEVRDRLKDVIISGGENIASLEVEHALLAHPAIAEAAVIAAPDPKWGEVPAAFVRAHDGHAVTAAELIAWLRVRLAGFKVPRQIRFTDLPRTSTGKVRKTLLRETLQ